MNNKEHKEFVNKFVDIIGRTTLHYEFKKDVDPVALIGWIEEKKKEWQKDIIHKIAREEGWEESEDYYLKELINDQP